MKNYDIRPRRKEMAIRLTMIRIDKPDATNFILGQTHLIKSVEDIHKTLVRLSGRAFGCGQQMTSGLDVVGSNDTGEQAVMADALEAARQL